MFKRCAMLCAVFVVAAVCSAQDGFSIQKMLAGTDIPASIKASELKPEHKAIKINFAGGGGGGIMDMFMGMFRGLAGAFGSMGSGESSQNADQEKGMRLLSALDLFWTDGRTVKLSGAEFLVAYRYELELSAMSASGPPKLSPDTTSMTVALINLGTVASLSPRPDMTREMYWDILKSTATMGATEGAATTAPATFGDTPVQALSPCGQTLSRVKQLALAAQMYATDWDDELPYAQSTASVKYVTMPYLKEMEFWKTLNPSGSKFYFNMALAGSSISDIDSPAETVMLYESSPWEDGSRCVAFADGHAKTVSAEDWTMLSETLRLKLPKHGKPLPANYGIEELKAMGIDP